MTCANCGAEPKTARLVDDFADREWCNDECYRDWASDNYEYLAAYYRKHNVYREDGA